MSKDDQKTIPEADMTAVAAKRNSVKTAIEKEARAGAKRLPELVQSVAKKTHTDTEVVTAAIWELVDDNRLTYGADARPKTVK